MDYTKGRNLYSESRSVAGYLNAYGNQISSMSSTYKEHTSDWIPVEGIDAITIQAWVPNISSNQQTWIGYTFFTDKDLASHIGSRPAKYGAVGVDNLSYVNVAVPDTAKYVRVSYRKFNTGYVKVEYGSEATTWSPAPEDAVDIISEGGGGIHDPRP